jgi:hypothetical protein
MVFRHYPGVTEELEGDIWGQMIAGNKLLWEIFMRLYQIKVPLRVALLTDLIWQGNPTRFTRKYVRSRIEELIYIDRLLTKTNIGSGAYVQLTKKGQRLAEIAKRIVETNLNADLILGCQTPHLLRFDKSCRKYFV